MPVGPLKSLNLVIAAYNDARTNFPEKLIPWETFGQAKIVLKIKGEQQLRELEQKAKEKKIPTGLVIDNGHTQIAKGSVTCCAIGPGKFSGLL
jgi:PTH2 family peptidyl-tRNA hydrolase